MCTFHVWLHCCDLWKVAKRVVIYTGSLIVSTVWLMEIVKFLKVFRHTLVSPSTISRCRFHSANVDRTFWERDPKSGYGSPPDQHLSKVEIIREGLREIKKEIAIWRNEVIEKFDSDPILQYHPGVVDKQWTLHDAKDLENWTMTCDADNNEGFSSCKFIINGQNKGVFKGFLSTDIPKDGKTRRAGYCSIRTKRARKSFKRESYLNWTPYTHLVLRVRGDGRSYLLNISTCGYFDQLWNDVYHYILYTRGGPYWQVSKIPFSKFFFTSKGRVQDIQQKVPLDSVTHFGITAADKINGPFSLEIDYIGLEFDPTHTEEFAYEMYTLPKNIAGY